ncbi:hypothetical protein GW796_07895 [archaeon]|nr:hypothetical protein [archaeon]
MNKIKTAETLDFLSSHYNKKGIHNSIEDWELTKKYKNYKGITCRDFSNLRMRVRAIVLIENDEKSLTIIENQNYEYFLKNLMNIPVFYYVPTICNDGLVFVFELANKFNKFNQLYGLDEHSRILLKKKLLTLFSEDDIFSLNQGLMFAFPNTEMDEVIRKLERNQITYNDKLFDLLDKDIYQPILPDIALASYRFPNDENLNQEEAIDIIFSMVSKKSLFTNEDYARIKLLLKKIKHDEFPTVKKIALSFASGKDKKLIYIFDSEVNRKKAQELVRKIWLQRIKDY